MRTLKSVMVHIGKGSLSDTSGMSRPISAFVWQPSSTRHGPSLRERPCMKRRSSSLSRRPTASRGAGVQYGSSRFEDDAPATSRVPATSAAVLVAVSRPGQLTLSPTHFSKSSFPSCFRRLALFSVCACTSNTVRSETNERVTPAAALGIGRCASAEMYRSRAAAVRCSVTPYSDLYVGVAVARIWPRSAWRSSTPGTVRLSGVDGESSCTAMLQRMPMPQSDDGCILIDARVHACSAVLHAADGTRAMPTTTPDCQAPLPVPGASR